MNSVHYIVYSVHFTIMYIIHRTLYIKHSLSSLTWHSYQLVSWEFINYTNIYNSKHIPELNKHISYQLHSFIHSSFSQLYIWHVICNLTYPIRSRWRLSIFRHLLHRIRSRNRLRNRHHNLHSRVLQPVFIIIIVT